MTTELPREKRRRLPIIDVLLKQQGQALPPYSGTLNAVGKMALAISAGLRERRERKAESENVQRIIDSELEKANEVNER